MDVGAQKEKRKKRELQQKVPSLNEVQHVNSMLVEFLMKTLRKKTQLHGTLCIKLYDTFV